MAGLALAAVAALAWALLADDRPRAAGPEETDDAAGPASGGGVAGVSWSGSVVVDSGPGRVGPWRMNRSVWRYVDDPAVAVDSGGGAAVAWVDQERKDVLFQRYGPGGGARLPEPVDVSRTPEVFSWLPRVAVDPGDPDRVYLLWQEIVFSGGTHGGEAFFARSTDGGRTFEDPLNLSETPAGAGKGRLTPRLWHNGSLALALGPAGRIYAAWTVYEGGLFLARSPDGGESFSEPLRVTAGDGAEPARAPSLAVGPRGTVHLAWAVGGDPSADLRYATSGDGGRSFGDPRVLLGGPGHSDTPKLAAAGDGTLHLAWSESPQGAGGAYRVRYARAPADSARGEEGPGFGEPVTIAGPSSAGDATSAADGTEARFPYLALDRGGDPHLAWERYPGGRSHPRGLGFAASPDGGRTFPDPSVVPATDDPAFAVNGSLQGRLMRKLDVGPGGAVAVVNSGFTPDEASRVLLVRGRSRDP